MKILWATVALELAVLLMFAVRIAANDEQPDVKPYKFAQIDGSNRKVELYKTVHQGCELFVAINTDGGYEYPVAITTGRGCK